MFESLYNNLTSAYQGFMALLYGQSPQTPAPKKSKAAKHAKYRMRKKSKKREEQLAQQECRVTSKDLNECEQLSSTTIQRALQHNTFGGLAVSDNEDSNDEDSINALGVSNSQQLDESWQSAADLNLPNDYVLKGDLHKPFIELSELIKRLTGEDLFLVGGALPSLYLREGKDKINDYDCLLLGKTLEELQALLKEHGVLGTIEGKEHHRILKIMLEEDGSPLEVEISTVPNPTKSPLQTAQEYVANADFLPAAMFMRLDSPPYYLDGERAKAGLERKTINLNNAEKNCFLEDASRLFRLAKWQIKYPSFELGDDVLKALNELAGNFLESLLCSSDKSIAKCYGGRFSTALEKMLERFEVSEVIHALAKLNILQELTGFDCDTLESLIPICEKFNKSIPDFINRSVAEQKKERLFFVFVSHYLVSNGKKDQALENWPFYKVAQRIAPASRGYYHHLRHRICQSPIHGMYFLDQLNETVDEVTRNHQEHCTSPVQFTSRLSPHAAPFVSAKFN